MLMEDMKGTHDTSVSSIFTDSIKRLINSSGTLLEKDTVKNQYCVFGFIYFAFEIVHAKYTLFTLLKVTKI